MKRFLRGMYWGMCGSCAIMWAITLLMILFGVAGEYDLTTLAIISFILWGINELARFVEPLRFLHDRVDD